MNSLTRSLLILSLAALAPTAVAGFSEPPLILYGKITNTVGRHSRPVLGGTTTWSLKTAEGRSPLVVTAQLEPLPGGFSYRLEIPVQKSAGNVRRINEAIEATSGKTGFTTKIIVNGEPASIVAESGGLDFSERQRGKTVRVDLVITAAFKDSDGDGLPDWWEDEFAALGFDKFNPSDAAGDLNGDGISNLQEYLNASNPGRAFITYAQWAADHQLTGAEAGQGGDFDFDGVRNIVEFALDTDPRVADRALVERRAHATPIVYQGRPYLRMNCEIPAIRRSGIVYVIESSIDLKHWVNGIQSADVGANLIESRPPLRPVPGRRYPFVRLRIRAENDAALSADAGIWALDKQSVIGRTRTVPGKAQLSTLLENPVVAQAAATDVRANSISDSTANWLAGQWTDAPHLMTITSGAGQGRSFLITAQTSQSLTVDTGGADLPALVTIGDRFELRPAHTLAGVFGNPPQALQSGSETTADLVGLWNGAAFDQFFHNGTSWQLVGAKDDRSRTVILPDEGFLITNRGRRADGLYFFGLLPSSPRAIRLPPGKSFVATLSPFSQTLIRTGLANLPGWTRNDQIAISNGKQERKYFYSGKHWRAVGLPENRDRVVIPRNTAFFIERPATATEAVWKQ